MAYFKALSQYLLGGRVECMQTGQTAKGQTWYLRIYWIWSRHDKHSTGNFLQSFSAGWNEVSQIKWTMFIKRRQYGRKVYKVTS